MFGPHLIIDASKCNITKLADRHVIERILIEYPRAIGMTRIGGPYMFEYQSPDPDYSGVSGLVVIAESHIALHTFPYLDYFTMDIFSCKNFDYEAAISYIRDALDVREMDRMLIQRGLSFRGPHHGPDGATDELIAAMAHRNTQSGVTIGTIPPDDPLYPKPEGQMVWPAYGVTPDLGTMPNGKRNGTQQPSDHLKLVNVPEPGAQVPDGWEALQPMALNPTASISGLCSMLETMGGEGNALGTALKQWEMWARGENPIVLAVGPSLVAQGMRDLIVDLLERGLVTAIIAEGDTLCADAFESLGYRHFSTSQQRTGLPLRIAHDVEAARAQVAALSVADGGATFQFAARLGAALADHARRPGILITAARREIPVFAVAATDLPLSTSGCPADVAALADLLAQPGTGIIAFGTTHHTSELVAATGKATPVIAIAAAPYTNQQIVCTIDATVALPLLATGIAQRVPQRHLAITDR